MTRIKIQQFDNKSWSAIVEIDGRAVAMTIKRDREDVLEMIRQECFPPQLEYMTCHIPDLTLGIPFLKKRRPSSN